MMTREERLRALIGNLKNQSWDVNPVFKIEREDANAILSFFKSFPLEAFDEKEESED